MLNPTWPAPQTMTFMLVPKRFPFTRRPPLFNALPLDGGGSMPSGRPEGIDGGGDDAAYEVYPSGYDRNRSLIEPPRPQRAPRRLTGPTYTPHRGSAFASITFSHRHHSSGLVSLVRLVVNIPSERPDVSLPSPPPIDAAECSTGAFGPDVQWTSGRHRSPIKGVLFLTHAAFRQSRRRAISVCGAGPSVPCRRSRRFAKYCRRTASLGQADIRVRTPRALP